MKNYKEDLKKRLFIIFWFSIFCTSTAFSQGIIINHTCTKISQIPESAILTAKKNLRIAYGHTSHGSQLTDGMNGLIAFMNGKGYTHNLYAWNKGGTGGALDLHDYAMSGDVGYYPDWVNNTRRYLGNPDPVTGRGTGVNAGVNVIIWSWCGQVTSKHLTGKLFSEYIDPMVQLEMDYPGIRFVYMTGHLDHSQDAANKAANQSIRNFCSANQKVLYDFADIESYDPDGKFYQFAGDDCSYYVSATGGLLGNWATEWQNSHPVNVDWYNCSSAHSKPLNANQKAYAAWWLWARLAGWNQGTSATDMKGIDKEVSVFPNPSDGKFTVTMSTGKITAIMIYNALGTNVFSASGFRLFPRYEIDLSDFEKGFYFLKIDCGNSIQTKKILINQ